jgi:hypothetical protein
MTKPSRGYIPRPDADFDYWQKNFITIVTACATALGILPAELTAIKALQTLWEASFAVGGKGQKNTRTTLQTSTKTANRITYERAIRIFTKRFLIANPALSDAQRNNLRITVSDKTRSFAKITNHIPVVQVIPVNGSTLVFTYEQEADATGVKKKGKPENVHAMKIYYMIGDTPPTTVEDCNKSISITKSPYHLKFQPWEAGKKIFGFCCWINSKEEEAGLTPMFSAIIPM